MTANLYFATIAELRLRSGDQTADYADIAVYRTGSRRGGGRFAYDSTDITTADDGCSVLIDADGKRWKKIFERGEISVDESGAYPGDTVSDSRAAFILAQTVAVANGLQIVASPSTYYLSNQVDLVNWARWDLRGARIYVASARYGFFADGVNDWTIKNGVLHGSLDPVTGLLLNMTTRAVATAYTNPANATGEAGMYVKDCKRYRVENCDFKDFYGYGYFEPVANAGNSPFRGDRGYLTNLGAFNCHVGINIADGPSGEYKTITDPHASGCCWGMKVSAGNVRINNPILVDNDVGFYTGGGYNHGHGTVTGGAINHNFTWNLHAKDSNNGMDINDVDFYGDGSPFAEGKSWIDNCAGFRFRGGKFIGKWYNDRGTQSALNIWYEPYCPGGTGSFVVTDSVDGAAGSKQTAIINPTGPGAPRGSRSTVMCAMRRTDASQQDVTVAGTVLTFDTTEYDRRGVYSAGTFTAPAGEIQSLYRASGYLPFEGASLDGAASKVVLKVGANIWHEFYPTISSTTELAFVIEGQFFLNALGTVTLEATISGSAQKFGRVSNQQRAFFCLEKVS